MHGCEEKPFLLEKWWGLCSVSKIQIWRVSIMQDISRSFFCQILSRQRMKNPRDINGIPIQDSSPLQKYYSTLFSTYSWYSGTVDMMEQFKFQRKSKRGKIWKKRFEHSFITSFFQFGKRGRKQNEPLYLLLR